MTPWITVVLFRLAQADGSIGDFLYQVRGLVTFICALGILWIVLLVLTIQRNAERRRRERLGLEPLPGLTTSLYNWLSGRGSAAAPAQPPFPDSSPALDEDLPAPDLGLLTGNLPEPDLDAITGEDEAAAPVTPSPAPSMSAGTPAATAAPEIDPAALERYFPLEDAAPASPSAPQRVPDGTPPPPDSVELLRIFRDLLEGSLIVVVDGYRYDSAEALHEADLARRLAKIARDLALMVRDIQQLSKSTPPPSTPPSQPAQPPAPALPDAVEVLRVFRDLSDGTLIIEIEGQHFHSPQALHAASLGRRFTKVVRDLALLVKETQQIAKTAPPPTAPPAQRERTRITPPLERYERAGENAPPPDSSEAGPPSRTPPRITLPDDELPSMAPGAMFRGMTMAARGQKPDTPPEETPPPLSIAEQIETLLQQRLAQSAEFRGRKIHVKAALSGGVRIQVDDRFYDGIDEVQDEAVRTLLQDVVREWEDRGGMV